MLIKFNGANAAFLSAPRPAYYAPQREKHSVKFAFFGHFSKTESMTDKCPKNQLAELINSPTVTTAFIRNCSRTYHKQLEACYSQR